MLVIDHIGSTFARTSSKSKTASQFLSRLGFVRNESAAIAGGFSILHLRSIIFGFPRMGRKELNLPCQYGRRAGSFQFLSAPDDGRRCSCLPRGRARYPICPMPRVEGSKTPGPARQGACHSPYPQPSTESPPRPCASPSRLGSGAGGAPPVVSRRSHFRSGYPELCRMSPSNTLTGSVRPALVFPPSPPAFAV